METTKPFLYLDLSKGWKEELHPRDMFGKFATVKGGSRIVTKTGKTGVVHTVTGTHYHVTDAGGKKFKVLKDNAIHFNDHAKATAEAKKRQAKTKKATTKGKATKATNKANGTGKSKPLADPTKAKAPKKTGTVKPKQEKKVATATTKNLKTASEAPKKTARKKKPKTAEQVNKIRSKNSDKQASEARKKNKAAKKERDMKAPARLTVTVPQKKHDPDTGKKDTQNQALEELKNLEQELPKTETVKLSDQWNEADVQKIMNKPANKRSAKDINAIAGKLTTDNDKLARYVANKAAESRGIFRSSTIIGNKATRSENVIRQDSGLYGDMLQSTRATMFETLTSVLSGAQNPGEGTAITAHVISRMKHKLHRDLYSMLNDLPAPHEVRGALADAHKAAPKLAQTLGRTPSHEELAEHLQKNSKAFREAPIAPTPKWDDKAREWVAQKARIEDPAERLRTLQLYASQQKATTLDKNVGNEGERDVALEGTIKDRTGASVEDQYEAKERQKELQGALPKAMKDMGLSNDEVRVMSVMYSQSSETGSKAQLTAKETAERLTEEHGMKVDLKWVLNRQAAAFKKIAKAKADNHPAIQELMKYLTKSLMWNTILKSMYEFDLVKSLKSWGVDPTVLEQQYTRTVYSNSRLELQKSLMPHEYVGSFITMDDGEVIGRIVELGLPESNALYKSFNNFNMELQKSMFPHKDAKNRNHVVNSKATEYVKKNSGKYKALASDQQSRAKGKSGTPTWSEQLLLDNPGTCWITWGGKKILVHGSTGEIKYDSGNDAHREEHNQGAQSDKIDYHHEKEALEDHEKGREKATHDAWKAHISEKEAKASKGKGQTVDYGKERESFAKKNRGAEFDEEGNLKFNRDSEVHDANAHVVDHGIGAFREQMDDMGKQWKDLRAGMMDDTEHKYTAHYAELSEDEREALGKMSKEERINATGKHFLEKEGVKDRLRKLHEDFNAAGTDAEKMEVAQQAFEDLKGMGTGSMALNNAGKMLGKDFKKGNFAGILADVAKMHPDKEGNLDAIADRIGSAELSRGREEVSKNHIPEGKFMIGNPRTGKTMAIQIGHGFDGGRAGKGGKFAPKLLEAFDPDGGNHEDSEMSWGQLGKLLGYTGTDAQKLKENLVSKANSDPNMPFMKPVDDEEFMKHRANTKLGLQDTMLHKDFKLVNQERDKDGNITSQTFAQKMQDGTTNHISVGADGMIKDPLMQRLLNQRKPVTNAKEVNELLKNGVGNRRWVTAHFGSDIHVGDALGHHVQLEYDGKGAPKVVGGKYDGYRYIDSRDVPKGSIDPATGEPVKALFKNGKLIDRKFSTSNEVPMKVGGAVMYPNGDGGFRKGRIHSEVEGGYKITDGKGHVIGVYKKGELKNAKEEGRTLSDSGNVAVQLAQTGKHRMNVDEAFADMKPKARELFEQALRKAKINTHAFEDGKLKSELELSDPDMKKIKKVLGRSKAGREMLKKFNSAFKKELEVHVPEHHRSAVEQTGINVRADGTAKISAGKFEELRDAMGALSIHNKAQEYLQDHFSRKDRKPKEVEELRKTYQPSTIDTGNKEFDNHYKAQFKSDSYLMNPEQGLYKTQLEGADHLIGRGRAIAGHGMGTGKTILGVVAALNYKADKLAKGEKPKKTLIVAPKGIMSDWGKEIGSHSNSKGLYIGSGFKGSKNIDGKKHWGQEGTEQEATSFQAFKKGSHADGDHDFHIVSYDTFMRNRDHFTGSGMYDNVAIDEIHAFKNQKGKRGQSLAETTDKFKNVWGLSGTPMENDAREVWSLVDTVTGGKHELGNQKEFQDKFMVKDRNGKITGVKHTMKETLGDNLANVVQFRGSEDVEYNDGSKIQFPSLVGHEDPNNPNPVNDFVGNMADRSRDHQTNDFYGTKHSVTDFEEGETTATRNGESYTVKTFLPKNATPAQKDMYEAYNKLQQKYLPESKLQEMASAAATGYDQGQKGGSNYMTAMQKLQKFLNAPLSHKMYAPGGNAIESNETGVQSEKASKSGIKQYDPKTGEGHYTVDSRGMKRYFESDDKGGFIKNPDGTPKELPPLHHNNPKAQYLQKRIHQYLDGLQQTNKARVAEGKKPMVPKMVVKSAYTTFGTDIIDNVLKDVRESHPIFRDLHEQGHTDLGQGRFTGDAGDREQTKVGFRGNKNDYANNQGNLWATTVSPAGKEGVDFGNAHAMFHYDQDWNPQKMAQFTARVRRSDSVKTHAAMGRSNSVRVESLHMPGTIEDFMFSAQDAKIADVQKVVSETKLAEKNPKLGETESKRGYGHRGFTSNRKKKVGAKPQGSKTAPKAPSTPKAGGTTALPKGAVAQADKALKLVILL
jgi:hypothetical protein